MEVFTMGQFLSTIIANIFLSHFETQCLAECPTNFKPKIYRLYLDDTFYIFRSKHKANIFYFINSRHAKFTFEGNSEKTLAILDVKITRENNFNTSVYRKPIFTGQGINFFSNIYHK